MRFGTIVHRLRFGYGARVVREILWAAWDTRCLLSVARAGIACQEIVSHYRLKLGQ